MRILEVISQTSDNLDKDSYLEYDNVMEFYNWILSLKPKDVRDKGISQQALYKIKTKIKSGKNLNPSVKVVKILLILFKGNYLINGKC